MQSLNSEHYFEINSDYLSHATPVLLMIEDYGFAACGNAVLVVQSQSDKNYGRYYVTCGCPGNKNSNPFYMWATDWNKKGRPAVPCKNQPRPPAQERNWDKRPSRSTWEPSKQNDPNVANRWVCDTVPDSFDPPQLRTQVGIAATTSGPSKLIVPDEQLRTRVAKLEQMLIHLGEKSDELMEGLEETNKQLTQMQCMNLKLGDASK